MTEHLTMNTVIHAAVRRDLTRFEDAFAAFPPGTQMRANLLAKAWSNFSFQPHHHHADEETIFWPALRELGASESLLDELEGEHAQMLEALNAADDAVAAFQAGPNESSASTALATITDLETVIERHLVHEERDMEPIAAAHVTAPQMKAAQKAVRRAHKGNAGTFFTWLLDGADPDARAGLRHEIPPPVLFLYGRLAGRSYTREIAPAWA